MLQISWIKDYRVIHFCEIYVNICVDLRETLNNDY